MNEICTVILAAGKGTRMKSARPKVMHAILDLPLICYPMRLARAAGNLTVGVIGHQREIVGPFMEKLGARTVVQDPPLGTGHAVAQAADIIAASTADMVLIIPGDMPLITAESISGLKKAYAESGCDMAILTARMKNPFGYGRIVRTADGAVAAIVEQADATDEQLKLNEVNTGVYLVSRTFLLEAIQKLAPDNAKGEFYLTDIVAMAGKAVAFSTASPEEANGINSQAQLAEAAACLRDRINAAHLAAGVSIIDPLTTWIGPDVKIDPDVTIWPGAHILGESRIGSGAVIRAQAWISNSRIAPDEIVGPGSIIENR